MIPSSPSRAVFSIAAISVFLGFGSARNDAHAQAWVDDKGALDLSFDYNFATSSKVVGDDVDFPSAGTRTHQIMVGVGYVPVSRLAVNVSLPLALLTYTGDKDAYPHPGGGRYDDGEIHAALTDLRAQARYQVLEEPFALSPHIGASIPVSDYETVGNTVAGRHLKALHLGLGIGRVFGAATYVHLLYEFSLVEKYDRTPETAEFGQNRSDVGLTIGHKLLDQRLDVHVDANARLAHGGANFSEIDFQTPTDNVALYHDAVLKEDIVLVGGGVGYQISDQLDVSLSGRLFVTGVNTQNASVVALGVTWSPLN
jgi:hypothetical protein